MGNSTFWSNLSQIWRRVWIDAQAAMLQILYLYLKNKGTSEPPISCIDSSLYLIEIVPIRYNGSEWIMATWIFFKWKFYNDINIQKYWKIHFLSNFNEAFSPAHPLLIFWMTFSNCGSVNKKNHPVSGCLIEQDRKQFCRDLIILCNFVKDLLLWVIIISFQIIEWSNITFVFTSNIHRDFHWAVAELQTKTDVIFSLLSLKDGTIST